MEREPERPPWAYYAAIVLFVAVVGFAVLGLVRSTSRAGAATGRPPSPSPATTPTAPVTLPRIGPVATPQIPPPPPSAPTQPPSRTYLFAAPELATTAAPSPGAQPRR